MRAILQNVAVDLGGGVRNVAHDGCAGVGGYDYIGVLCLGMPLEVMQQGILPFLFLSEFMKL